MNFLLFVSSRTKEWKIACMLFAIINATVIISHVINGHGFLYVENIRDDATVQKGPFMVPW